MEMISRVCPLCGSSDTSRIFAEANFDVERLGTFAFSSRKTPEYMHYRLIDCPTCDLLYANPLPREEYIVAEYIKADYDSGLESCLAAATYASTLSTFIERLPDRHGALDIGAGDGAFLKCLLDYSFDGVLGVEPSRAPIEAAPKDVRPFIREGIFHGEDFAPCSFSLVTCFQTVEHLNDPIEMARAVQLLLKPGGAFLFICHNRRALSARLLGRNSPIFDIEHLQLFSPKSAKYLMDQTGFTEVQVTETINRYPLTYWLRLVPLPKGIKRPLISSLDWMGLGEKTLAISAGNITVIGFKPN
jgi:SAM-dependent methyltransferase